MIFLLLFSRILDQFAPSMQTPCNSYVPKQVKGVHVIGKLCWIVCSIIVWLFDCFLLISWDHDIFSRLKGVQAYLQSQSSHLIPLWSYKSQRTIHLDLYAPPSLQLLAFQDEAPFSTTTFTIMKRLKRLDVEEESPFVDFVYLQIDEHWR